MSKKIKPDVDSALGFNFNLYIDPELDALNSLNHANLVKMVDAFRGPDECVIIMELCSNGDLEHRIR